MDIYLDTSGTTPGQIFVNDTRFDFTSAINQPDGSYRQRQPGPGTDPVAALGTHHVMMDRTRQRNESGSKGGPAPI